jgi:hypothetical protein
VRLRDLLCFLAERTLHGQTQDLSEHRIGSAVFGKTQDYSVLEDSSVRVHVRQLRLKLHEYFDGEGRDETCIIEIPKGAYTTLFRPVEPRAAATPDSSPGFGYCPGRWPRFFSSQLSRPGSVRRQFLLLRRRPGR